MTFDWILLGIVILLGVVLLVCKIVQICKMPKEERRKLLVEWLTAAVVKAEGAFAEGGKGAEKMKMVKEEFAKHAPITYKIIMKLTKNLDIEQLIEEALKMVKGNFNVN